MKIIARWLTGKPFVKLRMQRLPRRMTLNEILDYNLAAGRLVVGW